MYVCISVTLGRGFYVLVQSPDPHTAGFPGSLLLRVLVGTGWVLSSVVVIITVLQTAFDVVLSWLFVRLVITLQEVANTL